MCRLFELCVDWPNGPIYDRLRRYTNNIQLLPTSESHTLLAELQYLPSLYQNFLKQVSEFNFLHPNPMATSFERTKFTGSVTKKSWNHVTAKESRTTRIDTQKQLAMRTKNNNTRSGHDTCRKTKKNEAACKHKKNYVKDIIAIM